jgi:hypothetical protein
MTIIGFIISVSLGACIGVVLAGLLAAAKDDMA